MDVFENKSGRLNKMEFLTFKEDHLHKLVEANLDQLFPGLEKIASQFRISKYKFDTLAFDHKRNLFVIIEYKSKKNADVSEQINAYRNVAIEHFAECMMSLPRKTLKHNIRKIDRSKIRVIVIKPRFTQRQIDALKRDELVDLCEVYEFRNGLIVNRIGDPKRDSQLPRYARRNASVDKGGGRSLRSRAGDVIVNSLIDGQEHQLQELYDHMFKTLHENGVSVSKTKAQEAVRSKLDSLLKIRQIRRVRTSVYQRA